MPLEVTATPRAATRTPFARLVVDGDRIVEADAPGMERPLAGLTLLEAAAVPGETLAADAVANAIAEVFRAEPSPGRVAVAMSGGVDSAVALLRARPDAVGVTLRLWLDPAGPDAERACCSPDAVIRARQTCHALGLPHVTLDLREEFRDVVVRSFVDGYAAGLTPNPCMRCNGAFRFAALVAFAERAGADVLWTGHYARGSSSATGCGSSPAAPTRGRTSRTCSRPSTPRCSTASRSRSATPTKDEVRAEAAAAGLDAAPRPRARRRASSRAATTAPSSSATASPTRPGRSSTSRARSSGDTTGVWRFTPGQRRGLGVVSPSRSTRFARTSREHARRRPAQLAGATPRRGSRAPLPSGRRGRGQAAVPQRARRARVTATEGGFALELAEPVEAVAPGQVAVLYDDDASSVQA